MLLFVIIFALTQSSACPRRAGTFVDDSSYTFENYPCDFLRSVHGRNLNETLAAVRLCASSSDQLLDSRRRLPRPDEIRFSSHSCERFGCGAARGRAIGKSSPSMDCNRRSIDTPTDYVLGDV